MENLANSTVSTNGYQQVQAPQTGGDDRIAEGLRALQEAEGTPKTQVEGQERYKATLARIAERERKREEMRSKDRDQRAKEQRELELYKQKFGDSPDEITKSPKRLLKKLGYDDPYKAFLDDDSELEGEQESDELPKSKAEMIKMYEEIAEKKYKALREQEEFERTEKDVTSKFEGELKTYADKFPLAVEKVTAQEVLDIMFERYDRDVQEHGEEYAEKNKISMSEVLETYQKHLESEVEKMLESKYIKKLLANKLGAKLPEDIDDVVQEYVTSNDSEEDSKYNSRLAEIKRASESDRDREIQEALALMEEKLEQN